MRIHIALMVAIVLVVSSCSSDPTQSEEYNSLSGQLAEESQLSQRLSEDLVAAQAQVDRLNGEVDTMSTTVDDLQSQIEGLQGGLSDEESRRSQLESDLARARNERDDAQDVAEEAESQVAELLLAFDSDIARAQARLRSAALDFACDWGTAEAVDGTRADGITGTKALNAFKSSDEFSALAEDPEISTAVSIAAAVGTAPYGATSDEVGESATGCWQVEDRRQNAALYVHQSVLRQAALDAACTLGADDVFDSSTYSQGDIEDTAVYRDWELRTGYDEVDDYIDEVESRFGSLEAFLGVTRVDLDAQQARCADREDLISPKDDGLYNVGEEIAPGTWKAFDVVDCYWARLATNGDIRDNFFGSGLRVTVSVLSSDGQLEVSDVGSRCVFYYSNP